MTRSLITGAAGFIGRRLVAELLSRGDQVVAMDRFSRFDPKDINWVEPNAPKSSSNKSPPTNELTFVKTDIRDAKAVSEAMSGVDRVFHAAATVSTKSLSLSQSINVGGTQNIAEAAASQSNPPIFTYVSSLAAAGPSGAGAIGSGQTTSDTKKRAATESDPCRPVSHYGRTKLGAERKLHELANQLPVTIVRPPCVFGPGDQNLLPLYQTVRSGWNLVLSKTFRYSYVCITDLIPGLITASERGRRLVGVEETGKIDDRRIGTYYLTDPKPVTFVQLADMIANTIEQSRVRHVLIPKTVGWATGAYGEMTMRLLGKRVFLNLDKIREGVSGSWVCDGTRAAEDLSFAPAVDLPTRIQQTTLSYQQAKWI